MTSTHHHASTNESIPATTHHKVNMENEITSHDQIDKLREQGVEFDGSRGEMYEDETIVVHDQHGKEYQITKSAWRLDGGLQGIATFLRMRQKLGRR